MLDINVKFLEEYKSLDKLCKEMFDSDEGVSRYILEMEYSTDCQRYNSSWKQFYDRLKKLRYYRNKLAHDVDLYTDLCTTNDVEWLQKFHNDILEQQDPLAVVRKQRAQPSIVKMRTNMSSNNTATSHNFAACNNQTLVPKTSKWQQFKQKIKKFFGIGKNR